MARLRIVRNIFRFHGFRESVMIAAKGIAYLFFYHRNMRIIFLMGVAAVCAGLLMQLRAIEMVAVCITVTLVFMGEIFNTAIELMMNMLTEEYHVKIKLVKDIAAAIVLLAALNAAVVGYIIFVRKLIFLLR
jgi:diacylglycerol kinase (ATP)